MPHYDELRPGEPLFGMFSRLSTYFKYPDKRAIVEETLGTGNAIATLLLPSHIDAFIARLPPGVQLSAESVIYLNTAFPAFAGLLPKKRQDALLNMMRSENSFGIHYLTGLMSSRIPLFNYLRLCPDCEVADRHRYGDCYYHLVHQMPGVYICPIHSKVISNTSVHATNKQMRYYLDPAEIASNRSVLANNNSLVITEHESILGSIAAQVQGLLDRRECIDIHPQIRTFYVDQLKTQGLATPSGQVRQQDFLKQVTAFYSPELLDLLGCSLSNGIESNWLADLVRKTDHAQFYLPHLLLLHFLKCTYDDFLVSKVGTKATPFGKGPWPCLNPVCPRYLTGSIRSCAVSYSRDAGWNPVGTFSCKCGFSYTRTGPDTTNENANKLSKIITFGALWDDELKDNWNSPRVSLRQLARLLGVDPKTIKRRALLLNLSFPRPLKIVRA